AVGGRRASEATSCPLGWSTCPGGGGSSHFKSASSGSCNTVHYRLNAWLEKDDGTKYGETGRQDRWFFASDNSCIDAFWFDTIDIANFSGCTLIGTHQYATFMEYGHLGTTGCGQNFKTYVSEHSNYVYPS